jgi:hypothetical protein
VRPAALLLDSRKVNDLLQQDLAQAEGHRTHARHGGKLDRGTAPDLEQALKSFDNVRLNSRDELATVFIEMLYEVLLDTR